jgi:hypothetical protein
MCDCTGAWEWGCAVHMVLIMLCADPALTHAGMWTALCQACCRWPCLSMLLLACGQKRHRLETILSRVECMRGTWCMILHRAVMACGSLQPCRSMCYSMATAGMWPAKAQSPVIAGPSLSRLSHAMISPVLVPRRPPDCGLCMGILQPALLWRQRGHSGMHTSVDGEVYVKGR